MAWRFTGLPKQKTELEHCIQIIETYRGGYTLEIECPINASQWHIS